MGLVQCPDCKKEISDSAKTCIGCGRAMGVTSELVTKDIEAPIAVVERKGGKFELIGTLLILTSMGGCSAGLVAGNEGSWLGIGFIGAIVGGCIFLYGRFF